MKTRVRRWAGRAVSPACLVVLLLGPAPAARAAPEALPPNLAEVADRAGTGVVAVFAQSTEARPRSRPGKPTTRIHTRVGSGIAVEENLVLTTASVVQGAERIFVRTSNGLQVEAQAAGLDPVFNVALLRVPDVRLPWLRRAARPALLGDRVIALGTSYGMPSTQSSGAVEFVYKEPRTSLLQLSNIVYPGNSGGAVVNTQGELVGVVLGDLGPPDVGFAGSGSEHRPSGMSFAMPIGEVWPVYEALVREGRVPHGYLGVSTRAEVVRSEVDGAEVGLGARVESVRPHGPADRAGLRRGDLIVAFDEERVEYPEQLARWVTETRPGATVDLVWVRGEVRRTGRTVLAESPDSLPREGPAASLRAPGAAPPATAVPGDAPRR
jgi:S1-C subfamily serine protease